MGIIGVDTAVHLVDKTLFRVHRVAYRATNGKVGHRLGKLTCLMLTTTGAKTGKRRETSLLYGQDGQRLILVASKGGSPRHPAWFLNLREHPDADVQVGSKRIAVHATVASGAERSRLWKLMLRQYSGYQSYQARTKREIPVVVLTPR